MPVADAVRRDRSATAETHSRFAEMSEFWAWLAERREASPYHIETVGLDRLDAWHREPNSADLVHRSRRFFAIRGLRVSTDHRKVTGWTQPIIDQPEVGILGILTHTFDGIPHYLMQAKMEPGNINGLQLSPTVQATYSNYTGVHRGAAVHYLEYFLDRGRSRVVYDALQSEQGAWFLGKRNRNMIVEASGDIPVHENFCWLTREQLVRLLREDNLLNMDSRSVLSGITGETHSTDNGPALHSTTQLLSWLTETRSRYRLDRQVIALSALDGWVSSPDRIRRDDGRFFEIIGVDVTATHREVSRWSQPMLAPCGRGLNAFLGRRIADRFHLLVQARTEAGTFDVVELGPTVSCIPDNYRALPPDRQPRFLDVALAAGPGQVLFDAVHSEEGGRLYHAENRYLIADVGEGFPLDVPDDYLWITPAQLAGLARYGNVVDVAARSLLTCLAL
ncbi:NDP-hexose 2,3-dehydratase family protein [Micromonospora sp. NPDC047134]|uniref:NDP-hexose 2,3-dehydratase family protein n=1 Tax=Micromonospora sp. NPDC047134 TaxID=3154340 RepID=UPI0033E25C1B